MKTVTVHDPMFRRLSRNVLLRHGLMALLSAGLVLIFAAIHGEWSPMHRWNRALADASLVLLAEHLGHGRILSTDERDFGAYRWKNRKPFKNLLETPR